jgi:hypothetical protein
MLFFNDFVQLVLRIPYQGKSRKVWRPQKKGEGAKGEVFSTMKQADDIAIRSKEEAFLQDTYDRLKLENSTNWK